MSRYIRTLLGTAVALIALVTSCAAPSGTFQQGDSSPAMHGEITPATEVDTQAMSKVNNLFSEPEIVAQAYKKLVNDCMASRGFPEYKAARQGRAHYSVRSLMVPAPLTIEQATTRGYPPLLERDADSTPEESVTEAQAKALMGQSSEETRDGQPVIGCRYIAQEEIFGDAQGASTFYGGSNNAPLAYINKAKQTPEMMHIHQQWSECMKKRGYQYLSPDEAYLQGREENLPRQDAECREEIGYEQAITNQLNAYLTSFLNENQVLIERIAQAKKNAEENAPKILDGTL
ncbi:MAG: hypothetical protein Q4P78_03925 [Rothia sp. (in: high G+C Gram-positive bacteria)]|uniref:hypothetical protein n=1 Tax=Rothia sp. (in: high G+C Gram-positive bacteria) TaxID=1885016 RepID=UPI0026E0552B|nr:hypothetical protein [Rothia sp. (in: high G+C Gram-positive bacteria)]MDO5750338.1 hypothetical protein [Rothia sp. (in: high G+C Gram-positive bacteria)]